MRLKATKTSLYMLVAEYEQLPPMKKTEFYKAFRSSDYTLKWHVDGIFYSAFLAACLGTPKLTIEKRDFDREIGRDVHTMTLPDLRARGIIDEQATVSV